jgi:YHS domain-containing protein
MRKTTLSIELFLVFVVAIAHAADMAPTDYQYTGRVTDPVEVCMVKRTVQTHTAHTYEYEGKTYHFCCSNCLSRFQADPTHLKWATDPVNGKQVDKASAPIYSVKGHAYFLSSNRSLKKFAKDPDKYLAQYTEK